MQLDQLDIPAGIHTTVLTGRDIVTGESLAYSIVWADRTYNRCPRCHQPVNSVTDCPVILNVGAGQGGQIEETSKQHGCGEWLAISWREIGGGQDATEQDIVTAAAELATERTQEIDDDRARRAGELREELRTALRRLREPLASGETEEDRTDEVRTGSETEPGIDRDGDTWLAWDCDPSGDGEPIVVTDRDIAGDARD